MGKKKIYKRRQAAADGKKLMDWFTDFACKKNKITVEIIIRAWHDSNILNFVSE